MALTVSVILSMLLLLVSISLYKKRKRCSLQEKQIKELEQTAKDLQQCLNNQEKRCQLIWEASNTVHLYASLSEEDTQSQALKQKQAQIQRLSETILQLSSTPVCK